MNRLTFTNNLGGSDFSLRSSNATARDAKNLFDDMPWKELSGLRITNPENITLEISGAHEDGMSITYEIANDSYITSEDPTHAQCRKTLDLFAQGDTRWKEQVAWEYFQTVDGGQPGPRQDASTGSPRSGCLGILLVGLGLSLVLLEKMPEAAAASAKAPVAEACP